MSSSQWDGRTVLIAGATSESGRVAARTLAAAGAHVIAVGRSMAKLEKMAAPRVRAQACDLSDGVAVQSLADTLHDDDEHVDGVLHLVGGWRGGGGLAGQTEKDFRFLEGSLTSLRHVTRAFDADLNASPAGRLAIVSSTAVARPLAGGANYAAVKAAAEAWTRAVAQGFTKTARDAGQPLRAAAVVFRVKALAGLEQALADAFAGLWSVEAAEVNDTIVDLSA